MIDYLRIFQDEDKKKERLKEMEEENSKDGEEEEEEKEKLRLAENNNIDANQENKSRINPLDLDVKNNKEKGSFPKMFFVIDITLIIKVKMRLFHPKYTIELNIPII